jgi:polyhydroxybutyrate depolymerase
MVNDVRGNCMPMVRSTALATPHLLSAMFITCLGVASACVPAAGEPTDDSLGASGGAAPSPSSNGGRVAATLPGSGGQGAGGSASAGTAGGSGEFPGTGGAGGMNTSGGAPGAGDPDAAVNPAPADGGASAGAGGEPSAPAAASSEACGKGIAAPMEGLHNIDVAGMKRVFFLRIPNDYDGKKAWPMVFAFHGAGNKTASWFDTNTGFRAANEDKAVMLFPESLTAGGNHTWMTASQHPANLAFVDAMIDWVKKNICIDPSRIFATGQSSGAYFGQTLACQRGDVIRAVATNSGGERYFENCKGNPGVMLSFGKADESSHTTAAAKATKFWIERNGCTAEGPMGVDPAPCVQYTGCKMGSPFVLCARADGHGWPGFANQAFWKFFAQF